MIGFAVSLAAVGYDVPETEFEGVEVAP